MSKNAVALDNPATSRRLLRSRLGRRLLLLFVGCALIPTCVVALLSYRGVTDQLTGQGRERLTALAGTTGKTLYDRLTFLEADLRRVSPRLLACVAARPAFTRPDCGAELLYAAEGVAAMSGGALRILQGQAEAVSGLSRADLPVLQRGQSALLSRRDSAQGPRIYLVHRPESGGELLLIARISDGYLLGPADTEGLPGRVGVAVLDPQHHVLLGETSEAAALSAAASDAIARNVAGAFEWQGDERFLASYWTLPQPQRFKLPLWRVVLSEPRADVITPIAGFTKTFPLVLVVVFLGVMVLSLSQIRRSLVPLEELGKGTRRIAEGDLRTPVHVSSGDELEELGGAFNAMTAKLDRQFHALETAAEIDRAILSSMDIATIAQTVLDRIPDICACEAVSLTVLATEGEPAGTSWIEMRCGEGLRSMEPAQFSAAEIAQTSQQPEWMILGENGIAIPGYLAHFDDGREAAVLACPLHQAGELLGVLALRDSPETRSNESLLHVRRLADRVAVALSNARMIDQVRVLAFYDALTRLPNRVLYKARLGQAIGRAQQEERRVAACSIDLDHFSRINDSLGHSLGDLLLQEVGSRLLGCSREEGAAAANGGDGSGIQVCRLGGDEFTVILPTLGTAEDALWKASRLLEAFQQPFRLGSQEVFVTASIGIAVYPEDGPDAETLHKNADVAMSHAKDEGRNTVELYSASMNAEALGRIQLEQELRKAVDNGEFALWYQPIVDLRTGWAAGAEALIRWERPLLGTVPPAQFIRLCEDSGLIVPLGEWILRGVCAQIKAWEQAGFDSMRVSVNMSARQLRQRGIVRTVQDILEETGVPPAALAIELTESLLMEPGGTTERRIRELAELGIALAIDDFGTGYSSLSYLKNFPVSTLKIDRSFIVDVTTSPDAAAITMAIIALARAMELEVVAEGVETKGQAAFLRERGCQKVQGFLFGRPAPAADFTRYLRDRQGRRARNRPREGAAL